MAWKTRLAVSRVAPSTLIFSQSLSTDRTRGISVSKWPWPSASASFIWAVPWVYLMERTICIYIKVHSRSLSNGFSSDCSHPRHTYYSRVSGVHRRENPIPVVVANPMQSTSTKKLSPPKNYKKGAVGGPSSSINKCPKHAQKVELPAFSPACCSSRIQWPLSISFGREIKRRNSPYKTPHSTVRLGILPYQKVLAVMSDLVTPCPPLWPQAVRSEFRSRNASR